MVYNGHLQHPGWLLGADEAHRNPCSGLERVRSLRGAPGGWGLVPERWAMEVTACCLGYYCGHILLSGGSLGTALLGGGYFK